MEFHSHTIHDKNCAQSWQTERMTKRRENGEKKSKLTFPFSTRYIQLVSTVTACAWLRVCVCWESACIQFSFSIKWNLSSLAFIRSSEQSDVKRIDCLSCWALRQHQQHYAPCAHLIYTIHFKCDTTHIHHSGTHSCVDARICATLSFRSLRFSIFLFYLFFCFSISVRSLCAMCWETGCRTKNIFDQRK